MVISFVRNTTGIRSVRSRSFVWRSPVSLRLVSKYAPNGWASFRCADGTPLTNRSAQGDLTLLVQTKARRGGSVDSLGRTDCRAFADERESPWADGDGLCMTATRVVQPPHDQRAIGGTLHGARQQEILYTWTFPFEIFSERRRKRL